MLIDTMRNGGGAQWANARDAEYVSFRDIWSFLTRHFLILCVFAGLGAGLGAFYLSRTEATYTATTRLVMDPEQGRIASQDASTGTIIIEAAEIASQVEIIKSEAIARAVINQLDLTNDPEIQDAQSWRSVLRESTGSFVKWIGVADSTSAKAEPATREDIMRRTMAAFLARVDVRRVGQSYVLEIRYTSTSPQQAAKAANAVAQAYIRTGMNERSEAARSGAKWLETRLIEIGDKAREAAVAVETFRTKNGITAVSSSTSLDQLQMSEISTQMLNARAETAAHTAKLEALLKLRAGGSPVAAVGETVDSPQIVKLREDMRVATSKLDGLRGRYDAENPAVEAAETEVARIAAAIEAEYDRIETVFLTNLDVAKKREELLETELTDVTRTGAVKNQARVELAEIESRAATYRRMYESILQQLIGTLQKQSYPLGTARVVTAATAPLSKTWPKTTVVLPMSTMLGFAAGLMLALARNGMDRRVRSGSRLRSQLGIVSLGKLPFIAAARRRVPWPSRKMGRETPKSRAAIRTILDLPYSPFGEALRSVKASVDASFQPGMSAIVGITSIGRGDGKTTIAANLAQLYSNEGISVVLVDADFQTARLSRLAQNGASLGLVVADMRPNERAGDTGKGSEIAAPANTGVSGGGGVMLAERQATATAAPSLTLGQRAEYASVPVVTVSAIRQAAASEQRYGHLPALRSRLETLRKQYEVIVVDMAGFSESADTRTICSYVDGIAIVLGNPDKITLERLGGAIARFGKIRVNVLGAIFNRCSRRAMRARER
jgi:uncharacterized protein involved in exopolysaccharide biosynthesis/cellulose biosynthesis protein BcsQ